MSDSQLTLKEVVKRIQFLKDWSIEQVAESIDYSRVHLNKEMNKGDNPDLKSKLFSKHPDILQDVSRGTYTEKRRNLKNSDKEEEDLPVFLGNTRAGTITIYSDDPSQQEPVGHLSSKIFPGCNHAEKINGDSMYPLAVNQGLAIGKIIDKRGIVWGEKYIIHTIHGQGMLKYVHPSDENKEYIKIVSHNKKIPPQEVALNDITFCCRVYYIVNPS